MVAFRSSPWLLLPLLLVSRAAAAPDPLSPAAAAGVAGGAGGAELAELWEREEAAPADGSRGLDGLPTGTIREALGGGVVEAANPGSVSTMFPPGPSPTPGSGPGGLRTVSRCTSPQVCVRVGLCPSAEVDVLFECAVGRVCCVPYPATPRPPPQQLHQEWTPQPQTPRPPQHPSPPSPTPVSHQHGRPQPTQTAAAAVPPLPRPQQPQNQPQHQHGVATVATTQAPRPEPHPHPPSAQTVQPLPSNPSPQTAQRPQDRVKPAASTGSPPAAHALLPDTDVCGKVLTENRITNGKIASMGQFPWMALLGYSRRGYSNVTFLCGGTLINERYVLTAAHCFTPQNTPSVVRLGEYNLTEAVDCDHNKVCAPAPLDVGVESIVKHEAFDFGNIKNDIALIRLQRSVTEYYSDYVRPICLPIGINVTDERKFKIAGWGKTDFKDAGGSAVLQFTDVNGVAHAYCNELQPPELQPLEPGQLCAGGDKGKDACKGDSGGPLMVTLATNPTADVSPSHVTYQIGVVSYGPDSPCGTVPLPSIYTRVATYVPWILANIRS